jgi:hypothetical protein
MSVTLAAGTSVYIAQTYGSSSSISAVTNANPAVATCGAGHGFIVGDIIQVSFPNSELLNNRVFRVSAVSTNDVTLEGLDTSSTSDYATGFATGASAREITAWAEVTQVTRDFQISGGEQQYADISTLKNKRDKKIPTTRTSYDVALPVFDDPSLTFYSTIKAANGIVTAGRFIYPGGSRTLFAGYWTIGDFATTQDSTLRNAVAVTLDSDPTRYAT